MTKKRAAPHNIKQVYCENCVHKQNDDGIVMWCGKIKMPIVSGNLNNCIHKISNK